MRNNLKYKLLTLFCIACFLFACKSNAQDEDAPEAVKKTFQAMYPNEHDPDWHIDKNGNYESRFRKKGEQYHADYAPTGEWIETEHRIKKKELPKAIWNVIKKKYDGIKIVEIEEVEHHSKGLFYDVEFKIDGEKNDVEFKKDGTIIN